MQSQTNDRAAIARRAVYWIATTLVALGFLSGGVAYLLRGDMQFQGLAELGYPAYFITILGVWKVLGGLAILAPGFPRLKEWAYAGIAFDLTGAAFSHVAVGHPPAKVAVPLAFLAVAATSWALRPSSRTLGAVPIARAERAPDLSRAAAGQ
jgi:uncharacterized membrane protein YphA (DoxX/SURF4 family)